MWVPTLSAGSVRGVNAFAVAGEVAVGSCATGAREPGQARKGAAFSGIVRAPQIAWPSPHSSRRCRVRTTTRPQPRKGRRPSAGTVPRRPA